MATRSPTPFHNYWGAFAGVANLPNVNGSATQNAALEAGDIAYDSVTSALQVCTDPTLNNAAWAPV
jgi:hypothetical protein